MFTSSAKDVVASKSSTGTSEFDDAGFAIVPNVVDHTCIARLIEAVNGADSGDWQREKNTQLYAGRNLLQNVPAIRDLADSPALLSYANSILRGQAFAVRAIWFDKTPQANWKVSWHQDLSIAVRSKIEAEGFGPWSVKAGVHHVQPPVQILERMVTLRLHLDDCGLENGPLQVLPGSHRGGKLNADQIKRCREEIDPVFCTTGAGGLLIMRPLLLHASSAAQKPGHRRVIHLEYAAESLPGGLAWAV